MIATILGLLVLIGGIAAGIVLVKQQQDIREKAAGDCSDAGGSCKDRCSADSEIADRRSECGKAKWCCIPKAPPSCTGAGGCYSATSCSNIGKCEATGSCLVSGIRGICCQECGGDATPTPEPTPTSGSCTPCNWCTTVGCGECSKSTNGWRCECSGSCGSGYASCGPVQDASCTVSTSTPTPTPTGVLRACNALCGADSQCTTGYCFSYLGSKGVCRNHDCPNDTDCNCSIINTPTPTPGIDAVCSAVKAYDANWNLLSGAQLSALSAGSVVRFAISGTPANQIDKARFTINGVLGPEITTKNPGTNEYYVEYTIPTGVYSFTVTAQIHHLTLGWF